MNQRGTLRHHLFYRDLCGRKDGAILNGLIVTLYGWDVRNNRATIEFGDGIRAECLLSEVEEATRWRPKDGETVAHWSAGGYPGSDRLVHIERCAGHHQSSGTYRAQDGRDMRRRTHTPGDIVAKIPDCWAESGYPMDRNWWEANVVYFYVV